MAVPLSAAVIIFSLSIAFSAMLRAIFYSAAAYSANWVFVHSGVYGVWLSVGQSIKAEKLLRATERSVEEMKGAVRDRRAEVLEERKLRAQGPRELPRLMKDDRSKLKVKGYDAVNSTSQRTAGAAPTGDMEMAQPERNGAVAGPSLTESRSVMREVLRGWVRGRRKVDGGNSSTTSNGPWHEGV